MKIQKIYISGPITGVPIGEVIAGFHAAEAKIRRFGYEAVSPLRNGLPFESEWADHMGRDIALLLRSDAIYLLPGCERSEGARIELCVALQRRMPLFADGLELAALAAFVDEAAQGTPAACRVRTLEAYGGPKT